MIKKAYNAGNPEDEAPIKSRVTDLTEGDTSTETGGRGVNLVENTYFFDATDPDEDQELADLLVSLGDEMDTVNEESLANFVDFMLTKMAEAKKLDYTELFNELMIKVNNADLVNTNEILKKLAKIYSRTLSLEYLKNNDLEKSKKSAYKKTLHRADQYLSE